jgi:hypothetical protein
MYTKHEIRSKIIIVGGKRCIAVVNHQAPFTVHILCFTYKMTPSVGGLTLSNVEGLSYMPVYNARIFLLLKEKKDESCISEKGKTLNR